VEIHENVLATIGDGTARSDRQLAKAYAAAAEDDPLRAILFEALRGKLTIESLRRHFRGPAEAVEFLAQLQAGD
jgi:hypothetical protein